MKKICALVLALVLVATFAYADVTVRVADVQKGRFEVLNFAAGTTVGRTAGSSAANITLTTTGTTGAITSGTVNGAVIGGSTPAAGTFTALTATGGTSVKVIYNTAITTITAGANPVLDCSLNNTFLLTPAQTESLTATNLIAGQVVNLIVLTSGTQTYTVTFSTGIKTGTSTLATGGTTGKYFLISYVSDGNYLIELSRTTAL